MTCIKDYTKFIILPYPPFFKENPYFLKKQRKLRILDDKATQKERLHSKSGVRFRRVCMEAFKSSALISLFRMTCSDHNHGDRSTGLILKTGNCQRESIKADGVILIDVAILT